LAERFGVQRATVTALLQQHGVEIREVGLSQDDIVAAVTLYNLRAGHGHGWVQKFSVDPGTVRRALKATGVAMRSTARSPRGND
jgi:hypothetical protein